MYYGKDDPEMFHMDGRPCNPSRPAERRVGVVDGTQEGFWDVIRGLEDRIAALERLAPTVVQDTEE